MVFLSIVYNNNGDNIGEGDVCSTVLVVVTSFFVYGGCLLNLVHDEIYGESLWRVFGE